MKALLPNSLYRAACFENFEGILGFSVPSIIWVGARLCKSQRNSLTRLRFLPRRERESFEQNTSIKLKYFTLVPEATNVSSEELFVDSEDVENAGGTSFFA